MRIHTDGQGMMNHQRLMLFLCLWTEHRLNLLQSRFHIIICKIITRKIDHLVTHIINIRIINNLCTNIWQIN